MKELNKKLGNPFIQESFADWLDDMSETDWSQYDQDPNQWLKILSSQTDGEIICKLDQYAFDKEKEAYANGYLPNAEDSDIRNWSNVLADYLL